MYFFNRYLHVFQWSSERWCRSIAFFSVCSLLLSHSSWAHHLFSEELHMIIWEQHWHWDTGLCHSLITLIVFRIGVKVVMVVICRETQHGKTSSSWKWEEDLWKILNWDKTLKFWYKPTYLYVSPFHNPLSSLLCIVDEAIRSVRGIQCPWKTYCTHSNPISE